MALKNTANWRTIGVMKILPYSLNRSFQGIAFSPDSSGSYLENKELCAFARRSNTAKIPKNIAVSLQIGVTIGVLAALAV